MKTCRTCRHSHLRCRCLPHERYIGGDYIEECYEPRETPLLVDVLRKALNDMVEIFNRADDADVYPDSCQGWDAVMTAAIAVLGRHQKEVGDA